jgi:molybdate transport system substrate-binding protein
MKFLLIFIFLINIIYAQNLKIAVAANVSSAMKDLVKAYKISNSKTNITVTIGSSGKLAAQILHGAPYDIFLSANTKYPLNLYKKGVSKVAPKVYAKGTLALFTTKGVDISNALESLTNENIKKIAIANYKTAPYGQAAKEALTSAKLYAKLMPKFVYGESIGQTFIFTLKATDVGIVAKSLLLSKEMAKYKEGKDFIEIDSSLYNPIEQGAILISNTKEAQNFYTFLFSKEAKDIFKHYGYIVK